jgi:hypothetical protein
MISAAVRRRLWLLVAASGAVLMGAFVWIIATRRRPQNDSAAVTARVKEIRAELNRGIALGATLDEVFHFLDAEHWEHSQLVRPEVMLAGARRYDHTPMVMVIRRNTAHSWFIREDIQIVFVFDDSQRLVRSDILPIYTGP